MHLNIFFFINSHYIKLSQLKCIVSGLFLPTVEGGQIIKVILTFNRAYIMGGPTEFINNSVYNRKQNKTLYTSLTLCFLYALLFVVVCRRLT